MRKLSGGLTRAQVDAYHSDIVGIVRKVFYRLHDVSDMHMFSAGAYTARARPLLGRGTPRNSGGEGTSRYAAAAAAIGEALERYSACWVDRERYIDGTAAQMVEAGNTVLPPEQVRFFTQEQFDESGFNLTQIDPQARTPWIESAEVLSGCRVFIPAEFAYLGGVPDAPRFHTPTSNGLAFDTDPNSALLSGILELVERDAFMLAWYHQLSLPRIDISSHRSLKEFVRRHIQPAGLQVALMDLSAFSGVPVVLSVARQANGEPGPVGVGAAADLSPGAASVKAMGEAVGSRSWAAQKIRNGSASLVNSDWRETIVDFENHVQLFSDPVMHQHLDFLGASTRTRSIEDIDGVAHPTRSALHSLAARLADRGIRIYSVDVTSPDVREAGGYVIRAYSPDLLPLDVSYRYRYLGHPRLRDTASLFSAGAPVHEEMPLNHIPHPFP